MNSPLLIYLLAINKFVSHTSGGWKCKTRMPAWLGSGESLFLECTQVTSHGTRTWWRIERATLFYLYVYTFTC